MNPPKKYEWIHHLAMHHGDKSSDFAHRITEYLVLMDDHPEYSRKIKRHIRRLVRDLTRLVEDFESNGS